MSTDFSIKSVGAPVATPFVQPASPAVDDAVATELPPDRSVTVAEVSARVRDDSQTAGDSVSHQVILDRAAGSIVYQVVDNRTSLVLKQFPEQGFLRRRAYARALQETREASRSLRLDRKI